MSVVPLFIDGSAPTVVQKQEDFQLEGDAVLIADLDPSQLREGNSSNVSYDLRIGSKYRDHRKQDPNEINEGGVVTLRPGQALIIQTQEYVHFPRRLVGIIAPKVRLLESGLSTTFSKVDPGYRGNLLITLFNLGQTVRKLKRGDAFCALTLLRVDGGARLYDKGPQQITARLAKQPRRTLSEWLLPHHVTATLVLIGATILLALATAVDFWAHLHH